MHGDGRLVTRGVFGVVTVAWRANHRPSAVEHGKALTFPRGVWKWWFHDGA